MKRQYIWLDITRGFAIIWIFLVHFTERFLCCPAFANPNLNWPALGERFNQLTPLGISGLKGFTINLLRYVGWMGDQGVQIFLVASGFALTLSALTGSSKFQIDNFYKKRVARILPLWVAVHVLFIAAFIIFSKGLSPTDWRTWASLFGFRFIPQVMYYGFPAWP